MKFLHEQYDVDVRIVQHNGRMGMQVSVTDENGSNRVAVLESDYSPIGPFEHSVLVNKDEIILCIAGDVCFIKLPTLELIDRINCDWAYCFNIYPFNSGYVVHGETCITHLDEIGAILWQFSARDIFVTDREYDFCFAIDEGIIKVIDWQGYEYHINSSGECINQIKHE